MSDTPTPAPAVTVLPHGPYLVPSGVPLVPRTPIHTTDGEPITWVVGPEVDTGAGANYALCRCGQSDNKPFCDGTHRRVEFQAEDHDRGSYAERSAPIGGAAEVVVRDDRSICVHAGFCGTKATNVWKMAKAADATETRSLMIAMIERCPSGALTYEVVGTEGPVEPSLPVQVGLVPDGPLVVTGGLPVGIGDVTLESRNRVTLCRCGHSANKPLCDGTHKEVGFRAP